MASSRYLLPLLGLLAVTATQVLAGTGEYYVTKNGATCLLLNVNVTYSNVNITGMKKLFNGAIQQESGEINGSCSDDKASATIAQSNNGTDIDVAAITFNFQVNSTVKAKSVWMITDVTVTLTYGDAASFSQWDDTVEAANNSVTYSISPGDYGTFGGAAANGTYQCTSGGTWGLLNDKKTVGSVFLSGFKAQPFHVESKNFTTGVPVTMCDGDKTPSTSNVVPIAVGAALCGLVLIVLVAYIIGRSRHQRSTRGYQSV